MGTTLTGTTPQDTYDSLIKVTDNGPLSGTAKYLSDGLGNDSVLALSTSAVGVSETSPLGKLHVKTADTSVSSVSAQGNLLVLEDTENGLSILSSTAGAGYINFGDSDDNDVGMIIYGHSDNSMLFYANAAERLRIDASGNVGIGTTTVSAKLTVKGTVGLRNDEVAAGYATLDVVPATAIGASANRIVALNTTEIAFETGGAERFRITNNGVTFNGDTAAANALDDYEEGTWTPSLQGSATAGTYELGDTYAVYTKIGRQVTASLQVQLASSITGGGSGYAVIYGLPFNKMANAQFQGVCSFEGVAYSGDIITTEFNTVALTSILYFRESVSSASGSDVQIGDFSANDQIKLTITYFV